MSDKSQRTELSNPKLEDDSSNEKLKIGTSNKELEIEIGRELKTDTPYEEYRKPVIPFQDKPSTSKRTFPKKDVIVSEPDTRTSSSKASKPIWPLKMNPFRTKYTSRKINFLDPVISLRSSEESVATIIEAAKHDRSGLRSSSSKSSASVKTFLPSSLGWKNQVNYSTKVFKLGNWELAYDVDNNKSNSCIESLRGLMRTKICKITMCIFFGIILPLILVASGYLCTICREFLNE